MPGALKLDNLQPIKLILFQKIFTFFSFILGGQFLLPQTANNRWPSRIGSRQEFKARESLSLSVCGDFFESFLSWDDIMYIMYTCT